MVTLSTIIAHKESKPSASHAELAEDLKLHRPTVTNLLAIQPILDVPTLAMIRQASQESNPFTLSYKKACALAGLKGKVADLPKAGQEALDMILSRRLAPRHIRALVKWIISGKPASEFDPKKVKNDEDEEGEKVLTGNQTIGQRIDAAINALRGRRGVKASNSGRLTSQNSTGKAHVRKPRGKQRALSSGFSAIKGFGKIGHWFLNLFWHWSFKWIHHFCRQWANWIVPLYKSGSSTRSKRSGRSGLNPISFIGHWAVYFFLLVVCFTILASVLAKALGFLYAPLGHWVNEVALNLIRLVFIQLPLWGLDQALHTPALAYGLGVVLVILIFRLFRPSLNETVVLVIFLGLIWFTRGFWLPYVSLLSPKWANGERTERVESAVPPAVTVLPKSTNPKPVVNRAVRKKSSASTLSPAVNAPAPPSSNPSPHLQAWSASEEPLEAIQAETDILSKPCLIEEYAVPPDLDISPEMATRRDNDLTDPDRFSVFIGRDKQTVVSVTSTPSGLTITFQGGINLGALSGGLLGGAAKNSLEIYWEDLKSIQCNIIEVKDDNPRTFYQLSMAGPEQKKAFSVQCASAVDFGHLASALEFWYRTAHKGVNAPIESMPYWGQGMNLEGENKVVMLWPNSPADKLGLRLGDYIWCLAPDQIREQDRTELERQLSELTPGEHSLIVVKKENWKHGKITNKLDLHGYFNPQRGPIQLTVP